MSRDAESRRRIEVTVRGRVQGVGFRVHAVDAARELGIVGWVANAPGGEVRCVAEGPEGLLDAFLERLRSGPVLAVVRDVTVTRPPASGEFHDFGIRSGWHAGD